MVFTDFLTTTVTSLDEKIKKNYQNTSHYYSALHISKSEPDLHQLKDDYSQDEKLLFPPLSPYNANKGILYNSHLLSNPIHSNIRSSVTEDSESGGDDEEEYEDTLSRVKQNNSNIPQFPRRVSLKLNNSVEASVLSKNKDNLSIHKYDHLFPDLARMETPPKQLTMEEKLFAEEQAKLAKDEEEFQIIKQEVLRDMYTKHDNNNDHLPGSKDDINGALENSTHMRPQVDAGGRSPQSLSDQYKFLQEVAKAGNLRRRPKSEESFSFNSTLDLSNMHREEKESIAGSLHSFSSSSDGKSDRVRPATLVSEMVEEEFQSSDSIKQNDPLPIYLKEVPLDSNYLDSKSAEGHLEKSNNKYNTPESPLQKFNNQTDPKPTYAYTKTATKFPDSKASHFGFFTSPTFQNPATLSKTPQNSKTPVFSDTNFPAYPTLGSQNTIFKNSPSQNDLIILSNKTSDEQATEKHDEEIDSLDSYSRNGSVFEESKDNVDQLIENVKTRVEENEIHQKREQKKVQEKMSLNSKFYSHQGSSSYVDIAAKQRAYNGSNSNKRIKKKMHPKKSIPHTTPVQSIPKKQTTPPKKESFITNPRLTKPAFRYQEPPETSLHPTPPRMTKYGIKHDDSNSPFRNPYLAKNNFSNKMPEQTNLSNPTKKEWLVSSNAPSSKDHGDINGEAHAARSFNPDSPDQNNSNHGNNQNDVVEQICSDPPKTLVEHMALLRQKSTEQTNDIAPQDSINHQFKNIQNRSSSVPVKSYMPGIVDQDIDSPGFLLRVS